jgi:copper chaperone NosL
MRRPVLSALVAVLILAAGPIACDDADRAAEAPPPAVQPDREAITYFGRMILVDHLGPKAQIHLDSQEGPLWFPAVRDAVAFTRLPGEAKDIAAIYVTDMAASDSWDHPRVWVPAAAAVYVIGSRRLGGMGAPEAVPFADRAAAGAFAERHGGSVVDWAGIPDDYVLGEVPMELSGASPVIGPDDICTTRPTATVVEAQPEESP